jgi:hypothetical protein
MGGSGDPRRKTREIGEADQIMTVFDGFENWNNFIWQVDEIRE